MKVERFEGTREEFIKKLYVTCEYCGYNNERARFLQFGTCLKCGKVLDKKTYFKIEMLKKLKDNKRRQG